MAASHDEGPPPGQTHRHTGRLGDAWKLDLAAPPVDGKANASASGFRELAAVPTQVRIVNRGGGAIKVVKNIAQGDLERSWLRKSLGRSRISRRRLKRGDDV